MGTGRRVGPCPCAPSTLRGRGLTSVQSSQYPLGYPPHARLKTCCKSATALEALAYGVIVGAESFGHLDQAAPAKNAFSFGRWRKQREASCHVRAK
jgi:hypothetical protein